MARRRPPTTHGILVVDKPAGVTSHDVVGMVRRRFGERQVGHGGTLDPSATGVLVVAVGGATRLLRFVESTRKTYEGEVVLGTATTTLDADGAVVDTCDMSGVTLDDVRRTVAAHLVGDIVQVPPMVSALKVGGRRLHELAREGVVVEREPRPVTIDRFDVLGVVAGGDAGDASGPVLRVEVECSAGTYVRTLADDLGRLLGGAAHLRNLRRTAVGHLSIAQAAPPDEAELLPVATAVRGLAAVTVADEVAARVANGQILAPADLGVAVGATAQTGPWALFGSTGELLAAYETHRRGQVKPAVVLPAPVA